MRIIAGEFRGRQLLAPDGDATRPITDRVKQSLFDILAPRLAGANVLDIFAGTGSMGLEALSRAAHCAWFFEADRSALQRLRRNIETLRLPPERAVVVAGDLFKWFAAWETRADDQGSDRSPSDPLHTRVGGSGETALPLADVVFLDPPYRFLREQPEQLCTLAAQLVRRHLAPDGVIIFRHDVNDALTLPELTVADTRTYGGMTLEFLHAGQQTPEPAGS